jgi:hypothetical protein
VPAETTLREGRDIQPLRIDNVGWTRRAREALNTGRPLELIAGGWRAKLLRKQLPRLAETDQAVREGEKLRSGHGFSVLTMWLLLPFHSIWFSANLRDYSTSWEENAGGLLIRMTK